MRKWVLERTHGKGAIKGGFVPNFEKPQMIQEKIFGKRWGNPFGERGIFDWLQPTAGGRSIDQSVQVQEAKEEAIKSERAHHARMIDRRYETYGKVNKQAVQQVIAERKRIAEEQKMERFGQETVEAHGYMLSRYYPGLPNIQKDFDALTLENKHHIAKSELIPIWNPEAQEKEEAFNKKYGSELSLKNPLTQVVTPQRKEPYLENGKQIGWKIYDRGMDTYSVTGMSGGPLGGPPAGRVAPSEKGNLLDRVRDFMSRAARAKANQDLASSGPAVIDTTAQVAELIRQRDEAYEKRFAIWGGSKNIPVLPEFFDGYEEGDPHNVEKFRDWYVNRRFTPEDVKNLADWGNKDPMNFKFYKRNIMPWVMKDRNLDIQEKQQKLLMNLLR